jgi:hypothetical protein
MNKFYDYYFMDNINCNLDYAKNHTMLMMDLNDDLILSTGQFYITSQAASKCMTPIKSGQKCLENKHLDYVAKA